MVSDRERALLGREAAWPAGRYSTIAGFVEPGESLEDGGRPIADPGARQIEESMIEVGIEFRCSADK